MSSIYTNTIGSWFNQWKRLSQSQIMIAIYSTIPEYSSYQANLPTSYVEMVIIYCLYVGASSVNSQCARSRWNLSLPRHQTCDQWPGTAWPVVLTGNYDTHVTHTQLTHVSRETMCHTVGGYTMVAPGDQCHARQHDNRWTLTVNISHTQINN